MQQHPEFRAPMSDWTDWANERYPFDGRDVRAATGFNVLRAVQDRGLAGELARGLCMGLPPQKQDPIDRIPPPIDFGYGNMPEDKQDTPGAFDDMLEAR